MSDTEESLRRKITGAADLLSVVRTMKAMSAASINQYETAVHALTGYYRTVELGLAACFREVTSNGELSAKPRTGTTVAIVFGSDQGLVGQFNEVMADYTLQTLGEMANPRVAWVVGERMHSYLSQAGMSVTAAFAVPNSVTAITPLIGQLLLEIGSRQSSGDLAEICLFYNRPRSGAVYQPVHHRLLPLDEQWRRRLAMMPWPTMRLPELMDRREPTLLALLHEYFFVSLFRACAESLASENASRLSAMQRAEKNIGELLDELGKTSSRLRQSAIDAELFDLVSGFEALSMGE